MRDATLDATGSLVEDRGPYNLTMSAIAARTGIGRATLYKYFPDVESVLIAWHERALATHLDELSSLARGPGSPRRRVGAVLDAYAAIEHAHRDHPLAHVLHVGAHYLDGRRRLGALLAEAAEAGELRDDVAPDLLAAYCINALAAAREATGGVAARRIAALTLDALRR